MFCDPARVGAFAVDRAAVRSGDGHTLFRLLVATTMFQRRQDVQILRILRGMRRADVAEMTRPLRLLRLADSNECEYLTSSDKLHGTCDLAKDPATGKGCCARNPTNECHLKRHTVLLKRYGHFGKMPTSLALMLREAGVADLSALRRAVLRRVRDPLERARALETELSRAWRVSQKIASMFLSTIANPDLSPGASPWARGVDWTYFVVVDSNVDLFLASLGYRGGKSYDSRREFVCQVARKIDLSRLDPRLHAYNPRVVQQALYLFMSTANRRTLMNDCVHQGVAACAECPSMVAKRCPLRSS
jgi:hypothetical protein